MASAAVEKYTAEQYYALTGETNQPMELHNGEIVYLAAPSIRHHNITTEVFSRLREFIKFKGGDCKPFHSPVDVRIDDYTVVQPDVFVVCDKNKIDEKYINGAPDLVIEVTSANRANDLVDKLGIYFAAGVREYWIVDTEYNKVLVYNFEQQKFPLIYDFTDDAPVGIYGGELSIKISELL